MFVYAFHPSYFGFPEILLACHGGSNDRENESCGIPVKLDRQVLFESRILGRLLAEPDINEQHANILYTQGDKQ